MEEPKTTEHVKKTEEQLNPLDMLQLRKGTIITKIEMLQNELSEVNKQIYSMIGN